MISKERMLINVISVFVPFPSCKDAGEKMAIWERKMVLKDVPGP